MVKQRTDLRRMVSRFRILRGWNIRWGRSQKHTGRTGLNVVQRRAVVYSWKGGKEPSDFVLHEVLHCAVGALTGMDKRKPKELFEAEELLVQDICSVIEDEN